LKEFGTVRAVSNDLTTCSYLIFSLHFSYYLLFVNIKVRVSDEDIASYVAAFGAFADALPNSIDRFWFLQFFQYFDNSDFCMSFLREFMSKMSTKLAVSQGILFRAKKASHLVAGLPLPLVQPFLSTLPPQRAQLSFEDADQSHVSGEIGNGDIFLQLNSLTNECVEKVGAQGESVSAPSDEK